MALPDFVQAFSILREIGQIKEDHQGKKNFRHLILKLPIKKKKKKKLLRKFRA